MFLVLCLPLCLLIEKFNPFKLTMVIFLFRILSTILLYTFFFIYCILFSSVFLFKLSRSNYTPLFVFHSYGHLNSDLNSSLFFLIDLFLLFKFSLTSPIRCRFRIRSYYFISWCCC